MEGAGNIELQKGFPGFPNTISNLPLPARWAGVSLGYRSRTQRVPCASSTNSPGRDRGAHSTPARTTGPPLTALSPAF